MAALLRHTECIACGKRHHFTLPSGDLAPDGRYEYICPETGQRSELQPVADPERVPYPPQGAVQLSPRHD
jgi:hypothetical protein